jgi:hypothetical protein
MEIFEFNGSFYKITQDLYEPRELYLERVWYILNKIENSKFNMNELNQMSRIWSNIKNLKCEYKKDLSSRI